MKIAILTTDSREHFGDYDRPEPYFGTAPAALLEGLATVPNIEVHVISCLQRKVKSTVKPGANIFYHGLYVPKAGWLRTGYQGCIRAVRRKLREIQPDIVHGQGTERDCALTAVFSGFLNVLTIHGNMRIMAEMQKATPFSFYWLAAKLETSCLRRTAGVFCNSAYTEALIGPTAKKTWRVPNALRSRFFRTAGIREKNALPILINVGVICERKQQLKILEMAERLYKKGVRFRLDFIGASGTDGYSTKFQENLKSAATYARYTGNLEAEDLVNAFDAADGLIHFPSEEAFGLVVGEAIARGLKFFGSRTGGLIDITEGVPDAELFPLDAWAELERGIERWIENGFPHSENGPGIMQKRYQPETVAQRHLEIYQEVLHG